MAKRRAKRTVKHQPRQLERVEEEEEPARKDQTQSSADDEVERRIAAIDAIRNAEIGHLLTGLRLLRSNFSNEQLQTPVMQFFKENMPNLSVKMGEKDGQFEVGWKGKDGNVSLSDADERNMHASLLQRLSKEYDGCGAGMSALGGYGLSSKAVNVDLFGAANLQIPDFVVEEPSETQMLGLQEAFQTPGANNPQRLSFGTTPKTRRLPKHGEMLLSVRGSPLGVFKEDNMEAINESEEG
ncbi:hypothetical protein Scep_003013 [Stephania cephalantha]|uniref:Uncharacterized protein n=1 Tax=Stephania cephalantha TaxID=152367 RepID=A0AAP0LCN3_9MAGN